MKHFRLTLRRKLYEKCSTASNRREMAFICWGRVLHRCDGSKKQVLGGSEIGKGILRMEGKGEDW